MLHPISPFESVDISSRNLVWTLFHQANPVSFQFPAIVDLNMADTNLVSITVMP
jgi:hypothetical protein